MNDIKKLLEDVASGAVNTDEALKRLKAAPFEDVGGYAKVDHHRAVRRGAAEVIYGEGKTADQIIGIAGSMRESGCEKVLITRLKSETAEELKTRLGDEIKMYKTARIGIVCDPETEPLKTHGPEIRGLGPIAVACAGTSDLPVAEEAAITAEFLGNKVVRLYDVGVAGIHRLLAHLDDIMSASVIIAAAGMEGALPGVIAGLASCPVIAVPTSVGYGASFGGLSALLSMLNSCAGGISVVNIDNGFGAGYLANMINNPEVLNK